MTVEFILKESNRIVLKLVYGCPLTWMYKGEELMGAIEPSQLPITAEMIENLTGASQLLEFDIDSNKVEVPFPLTIEEINETLSLFTDILSKDLSGQYTVSYVPLVLENMI